MLYQSKESIYSRESRKLNQMKEAYELRYVQHLPEREILSLTGLKRTTFYKFLRIFASEYPDLAEQMKKKGSDVTPEDYKKLLAEVSTLKSELRREKLRADFYEEMVAFGKEFYGIDLKKAGTK